MTNANRFVNKTYLLLILIFFIILSLSTYLLSTAFGYRYRQETNIITTPPPIGLDQHTFAIQKIILVDHNTGETLEFFRNGTATKTNVNRSLVGKTILSNQTLQRLFNILDKSDFDLLNLHFFSSQLDLTITIETNHGTKTIIINNHGETPLDDTLEELIDTTEDIDEEISQPDPPPLPSITPSPSPSTSPHLSPTPSLSPTPTPSPLPGEPTPTPVPFDCSMLTQTGVTVSNIRCLNNN